MARDSLSNKIINNIPNKKMVISLFVVLITLTFGAMVALANENTVVVEADILNVRYGPGLSHDVLTQVEEDDRLFLLGEENKWYKVRLGDDQVGWVASWLVDSNEITQENPRFARVIGEAVNIRQFSTVESAQLGTVYRDTEIQVLYQDGEWYQILYLGQVAWIHSDYVEIIQDSIQTNQVSSNVTSETSIVVIGDAVSTNIRNLPSLEGTIIYTAQPGEQFEFIEEINGWYHINIDGTNTAYVSNAVASLSTSNETDEATLAPTETVQAQTARTATNLSEATIVIDPGHGGYDPGAVSSDQSIYEKNISLSTAYLLANRLQDAGTNVILTRSADDYVSLDQRVQTAHNHSADLFISLHYDAIATANTMSGTTTYHYYDKHVDLANTINHYLTYNAPLGNNGVRYGDYYVLRANRQPSILVELGYMNHSVDVQYIDTQAYQATVVEAIYQALRDYYSE